MGTPFVPTCLLITHELRGLYMNKKDVLELKRRFKKTECTFTKMTGCYVDCEKNTILNISETFLNLQEEELFKYLEIAKKTLSGTIGNNLLELEFPLDQEEIGGRQQSLMALKESRLKDENLLESFYQLVKDTYDYAGNYLILLFHDAYDVITKASDNAKLDESEEVYEYILCAICPVTLSKPGLGYLENEERIGARERDWVVNPPENGFIFPAFTDRSTDIHSVMYYTKNAKEPHPEFMEAGLGCPSKQTATEQKETFQSIIRRAIGADDEKNSPLFMKIQENFNNMVEEMDAIYDKDRDPIILTNDAIEEVLVESGVPEEVTAKIKDQYAEEFGEALPVVEHLIDSKVLAVSEQRRTELQLREKVDELQQKLEETQSESISSSRNTDEDFDQMDDVVSSVDVEVPSADANEDAGDDYLKDELEEASKDAPQPNYDVILRVKPEKVTQIKSQIIDGKKCIIIPMEEDEQANVNGVNTML